MREKRGPHNSPLMGSPMKTTQSQNSKMESPYGGHRHSTIQAGGRAVACEFARVRNPSRHVGTARTFLAMDPFALVASSKVTRRPALSTVGNSSKSSICESPNIHTRPRGSWNSVGMVNPTECRRVRCSAGRKFSFLSEYSLVNKWQTAPGMRVDLILVLKKQTFIKTDKGPYIAVQRLQIRSSIV